MNADEFTGDERDLTRICKQVMNKVASQRLISKQEAMVLLADLPLTECTEVFSSIPLSVSSRLTTRKDGSKDNKRFIQQYMERDERYSACSMHEFFHITENLDEKKLERRDGRLCIPNFIGMTGVPRFPVTEDYAKHTLIVHKPWREFPFQRHSSIPEFEHFINSPHCPLAARLPYDRVMRRYFEGQRNDPTTSKSDHSGNPVSLEDTELLEICGRHNSEKPAEDIKMIQNIEFGKQFKWDKPPKVRAN